ncbi:MAG: hypothetical protein JEZ12_21540 [Desulfobacterium sp.]|nr:hypothetical protein [Desulfobacterium sp.]
MKPLFKKVLTGDPIVNEHVALVTGQKWHVRPYYWQHRETGEEYNYVTGGVVWPPGFGIDGYAFTVGVQAGDTLAFQCLEEIETEDNVELFRWCIECQESYGCKQDTDLLPWWYGDPARLMSLTNEKNIQEDKRKNRLVITPPPDFTEKDSFQTYFSRLAVSLMAGTKTLWLNDCQQLTNHVTAFSMGGGVEKDDPVINCAGWTVHALLSYEPWKTTTKKKRIGENSFEERAFGFEKKFGKRVGEMR